MTIYVGRKQRVNGTPAYIALCDLMHRRGLAGATVLLGVDGVAHGERQRANFFGRNADVPMMIVVVGSGERIARVLPELAGLLRTPLFTSNGSESASATDSFWKDRTPCPERTNTACHCGRS